MMERTVGHASPSLETAPRRKKSKSVRVATVFFIPEARNFNVRDVINAFFSCSKTVYCSTGLITRISAGPIPLQNALRPPVLRIWLIVSIMLSFLMGDAAGLPLVEEAVGLSSEGMECTVCDVWITQIGLLIIVVAEPNCAYENRSVPS